MERKLNEKFTYNNDLLIVKKINIINFNDSNVDECNGCFLRRINGRFESCSLLRDYARKIVGNCYNNENYTNKLFIKI